MSSGLKSFLFFAVCFSCGLSFFRSVVDKIAVQRDPAAINGKIFQISSLTPEQIKDQLQRKLKVTPTFQGEKTIAFNGFSSALCKTYSTIEVEFVAEGIAVAGEPPVMSVSVPCEAGQDPADLAAIHLPVEKILNEKPRNAEYTFDGYTAKMKFNNSADEWPRQWILKRVEFKNAAGENKSVPFTRSPASTDEQPIVLEF